MIQRIQIAPETVAAEDRDAVRPRPPLLRALGADDPPIQVEIGGASYHRVEIFKHDSWAATARYRGAKGDVVCKFHRQQPVFKLPMRWFGRFVARHEIAVFRRLSDVPSVPQWSGEVHVDGRRLANVVAHEFIPGEPLRHDRKVDEQFLVKFQRLLKDIHERDVAYCDLHKRENVLVGDDGEPYLFDFQISFVGRRSWVARLFMNRVVLGILQGSDDYHLQKHIVRCQPQLLSGPVQLPWWIRVHRFVAVPFRTYRRRLLVTLGVRAESGRCDTEYAPELGLRLAPETVADPDRQPVVESDSIPDCLPFPAPVAEEPSHREYRAAS